MQSRETIEDMLKHSRDSCTGSEDERAADQKLLEWVLGDAAYREMYEKGVNSLREIAEDPDAGAIVLRYALKTALRFL